MPMNTCKSSFGVVVAVAIMKFPNETDCREAKKRLDTLKGKGENLWSVIQISQCHKMKSAGPLRVDAGSSPDEYRHG